MQSKLLAGAIGALLLTTAAHAVAGQAREVVADEELVVALKTEHFEIPETDISHLAVGEAERIVTEYGRTVDLVRTEDGVEVYLDGQLLDIPMDGGERVIREEIEILCDTPADCDEVRRMAEDGDVDLEALEAGDAHRVIRIRKETEVVGGNADIDMEVDEADGGDVEQVIIIRKKSGDGR
jgi:hypothetical protein